MKFLALLFVPLLAMAQLPLPSTGGGGGGGGAPTGAAGGSLTGTYPNPGVVGFTAGTSNPATCTPGTTLDFFNTTSGAWEYCSATNTWSAGRSVIGSLSVGNTVPGLGVDIASAGVTLPAGLVAGSSGAAAANTAIINAALAAGQQVYIAGAPGAVYSVNTPLVMYSHSSLTLGPNVWLRQASNQNNNLVINYAATQPMTSSGVSLAWTSGTSATLTWPSHGQAAGSFVYVQGTSNYLTGTITYSSGLSACTNGTQNVSMIAGLSQTYTVVGTITVSGGVPTGNVTITNPSYAIANIHSGIVATCTGTGTFTGGAAASTDSAFSGVFLVATVPDSSHITITLRRIPNNAPAGVIQVQQADTDIHLQSVNLDWNTANQSGATGYFQHAVILSGVQNCSLRQTDIINQASYKLLLGGVRACVVDGFYPTVNSVKDGIKMYGPVFDTVAQNIDIEAGDDLVSVQPLDATTYEPLEPLNTGIGGGDILNVRIDNVHGTTTAGCAAIYGTTNQLVDDIVVSNSGCTETAGVSPFNIQLGNWQHVTFQNIDCISDISQACISIAGNSAFKVNTNSVDIIGVHGPAYSTVNAETVVAIYNVVDRVSIRNFQFNPYKSTDVGVSITGAAQHLDVFDFTAVGNHTGGGAIGNFIVANESAAGFIHLHNGYAYQISGVVQITGGTAPVVSIDNNQIYQSSAFSSTVSATVEASNNLISGGSNLLYLGGSTTYAVYYSGNVFSGGSAYLGVISGSPTVNTSGSSLTGVCTGTAASSSTLGLYGTGGISTTTCTSVVLGSGIVMQQSGAIKALMCTATAGGVSGSSGVVTVLKNGSTTTSTATFGTGTSASDIAHTPTYMTGDLISIQVTTQALETLAGVACTVVY